MHTTVVVGGELSNNKGINKAGGGLTAPALTAKDMEDIKTAMSFQCEYLAVSFPKSATDMEMARQLGNVAGEKWRHKPQLIAKIERSEAIPALESILKASDGIMVARGDLAVEVGNAAVPALQKRMIKMAREMDRVVITATQMMESMIVNPVPTRAEVSDVANAVLDGTDAVMLSAETAAGRYPVETVEMMASICVEAERAEEISLDAGFTNKTFGRIDQSIAMAALFTAYHLGCKAILALTESGSTALWMSRQKIHVPIFGLTSQIKSQRRMAMYRNVTPLLMPNFDDRDTALKHAEQLLVERRRAQARRHLRHHLRRADGLSRRHQHAEGRSRRLSATPAAHGGRSGAEGSSMRTCAGVRDKRIASAAPALATPSIQTRDAFGHGPRSSMPPGGCVRRGWTSISTTARPLLVTRRPLQLRRPYGVRRSCKARPRTVEPCHRDAGREHQRSFAFVLVREQVEHRADVVRRDPAVRHVAEEARLARIAQHHLGPLVPAARASVAVEEGHRLQRALALAEPHEAADVAPLVRRVGIPCLGAVAALAEVAPVALEGVAHERVGQRAQQAARAERDGARGRIEVAAVGRARQHVEAVAASCSRRSTRAGRRGTRRAAPAMRARVVGEAERLRELDARCDSRSRAQKSSQYE